MGYCLLGIRSRVDIPMNDARNVRCMQRASDLRHFFGQLTIVLGESGRLRTRRDIYQESQLPYLVSLHRVDRSSLFPKDRLL